MFIRNESWIYGYNPETRQNFSQWNKIASPWAKRYYQMKSTQIILIWYEGYCAQGISSSGLNSEFGVCNVLNRLWEGIPWRISKLWRNVALWRYTGTQFLHQHSAIALFYRLYSLDSALCDIGLLPMNALLLKVYIYLKTMMPFK